MSALGGFALLALGDAVVKSTAGEWPATAVSALRYSLGALGLSAVIAARSGRSGFTCPRPGLQLVRGLAIAGASIFFFFGVQLLPLADATAIQFTSPLLTALLSFIVLRERLPVSSYWAILLAFVGVLTVLRPNVIAVGPAALLPLGGALCMGVLMMANRMAAGLAPILTMQLLAAFFAALVLVPVAIAAHFTGWPQLAVSWPSIGVLAKVVFLTVGGTLSHILVYRATIRASAATVAPMVYVQLLVALVLDWLWFGNRPTLTTALGATLIIASGLWVFAAGLPRGKSDTEAGGVPD